MFAHGISNENCAQVSSQSSTYELFVSEINDLPTNDLPTALLALVHSSERLPTYSNR